MPKKATASAKKNKPASPKKAATSGRHTAAKPRKSELGGMVLLPGASSFHVKKEVVDDLRRFGKEFGISLEAATSLALAIGVMEEGLVLTPEEYEESIKWVEERWGVSIDRSKVNPYHPPATDEQRRIAQETHDLWVAEKRKEEKAASKKTPRPKSANLSRPRQSKKDSRP